MLIHTKNLSLRLGPCGRISHKKVPISLKQPDHMNFCDFHVLFLCVYSPKIYKKRLMLKKCYVYNRRFSEAGSKMTFVKF